MLDLKLIRTSPDLVAAAAEHKGLSIDIGRILSLDAEWRAGLALAEQLKARRNQASAEVARLKKTGQDAGALITEMQSVSARIKELDDRLRFIQAELESLLLTVPNLPDPDVPVGPDESANTEIRSWGHSRTFDFPVVPHWELGVKLDGLDFERGAKVAGSRWVMMKGALARLHRALVSYFLDYHHEQGAQEILPPTIVNEVSYVGSGQFPKFRDDVFALAEPAGWFLSATAEVPMVNMHRDEILDFGALPLRYVGYSGCYRAEAGAAGRDTRGLVRLHYFEKVEMVQFTAPETSSAALEEIVAHAECILQGLDLPYRVLLMGTGDLGFTQARKYDLEVWMPSYGRFVEISSCSNCTDFQARRANIRFRRAEGAKPEFVHTLNGSGLAVGRALAAVIENYQNEDGSITVPEVLRPYMGGLGLIAALPDRPPVA